MPDLTKEQVNALLKLQGYNVPEQDLTETTHRLNALMERLREFDKLNLYDVEPWPIQLLRSDVHGGR
jgi:benzoyl-CoA reductase/2-hydroxyglutaryl-CoA dehydratase subunit BcrC/BadD/HgdB